LIENNGLIVTIHLIIMTNSRHIKDIVKKEPFINLKGLKTYLALLVLASLFFIYLQVNGISIVPDKNTEHEGNQHNYGNHK
jgi:hypothetical protein